VLYVWILFNILALILLALDLLVFHRRSRVMRSRDAFAWSTFWIALAAAFAVLIFFWQGRQVALEFATGYVLELSLSVDNLFLFLVIFRYFSVPESHQHSVLFWGVLGAMLMRGAFILAGIGLIERFHWIFYLLGAVLIFSGIRFAFAGAHHVDPAKNAAVRFLRRWLPVTSDFHNGRFFVRTTEANEKPYASPGRGSLRKTHLLYATPLLIVLVVIETTDLLFAIDSIPAVLAVTLNAFIAYSSNIFAILGLRSMYFAVSGLIKNFRFLHIGLAIVLILIGLKMIFATRFSIPTLATLSAVALVIAASIAASLVFPAKAA
jgi:tellurite resistance protein TerC